MIPEWATGMAIVTGRHRADEPAADKPVPVTT